MTFLIRESNTDYDDIKKLNKCKTNTVIEKIMLFKAESSHNLFCSTPNHTPACILINIIYKVGNRYRCNCKIPP